MGRESNDFIKIVEIQTKKLFGIFDYTIRVNETERNDDLVLLYGENGSGKTTILKMIVYLLSSTYLSGHKSKILGIKFKEFSILLSNNVKIGVYRAESVVGAYEFKIFSNFATVPIYEIFMEPVSAEEDSIRFSAGSEYEKYYREMLAFISKMRLGYLYLQDTRKTESKNNIKQQKNYHIKDMNVVNPEDFKGKDINFNYDEIDLLIDELRRNLEIYFKTESLSANTLGEQKSNNIYLEIVEKILNSEKKIKIEKFSATRKLNKILEDVERRTKEYSKYGLVSTTEYSQIKQVLNINAGDNNLIYQILEPFIHGLKSKLDALLAVHEQISSFIECINSFLSFKKLYYSIQEGFSIIQTQTNEEIKFINLSSGEKQLFLLFAHAILAANSTNIFIIDEPEISLNIKWQRSFIENLLSLKSKNRVQYFIATHSFEILSTKSEDVVVLQNTSGD